MAAAEPPVVVFVLQVLLTLFIITDGSATSHTTKMSYPSSADHLHSWHTLLLLHYSEALCVLQLSYPNMCVCLQMSCFLLLPAKNPASQGSVSPSCWVHDLSDSGALQQACNIYLHISCSKKENVVQCENDAFLGFFCSKKVVGKHRKQLTPAIHCAQQVNKRGFTSA